MLGFISSKKMHSSLNFKVLQGLIIFTTLIACTTKEKVRPEPKITTNINSAGIKQFQISLQLPENKSRSVKSRQAKRGSGRRQFSGEYKGDEGSRAQRMEERVAQIMKQNGYCSEGTTDVDHFRDGNTLFLTGICKEKASIE